MLHGFALSTFGGRSAPRGGRLLVRGRIQTAARLLDSWRLFQWWIAPQLSRLEDLLLLSLRFQVVYRHLDVFFINLIHFESNESLRKVGPLRRSPAVTQQGI